MSNIDFSVKASSYPVNRGVLGKARRTLRQQFQMAANMALVAAAFLFVAAAVVGIFP